MSEYRQPKVKICGITNLEDARFVSGALIDYIGFIFYKKSLRYIEPSKAGAIINWIEGPKKVGVFVNQPLDEVNLIARDTGIDFVQLHGEESPEYCSLIEKPVIKAIHIEDETSGYLLRHQIDQYIDVTEYLLFDTKNEDLWGGTGQIFDWDLLKDLREDVKFFLSGGLDNANVRQAIEAVSPDVVDVCSSLESKPGLKDFSKVEEFIASLNNLGI